MASSVWGNLVLSADNVWTGTNTFSATPTFSLGILIPAAQYASWGTTYGSTGYGLRANSGVMEYKNFGGSWTPIPSAVSSSAWTRTGTDIVPTNAGDTVSMLTTLSSDITAAHTLKLQGYSGSAYVALATITNAATPTLAIPNIAGNVSVAATTQSLQFVSTKQGTQIGLNSYGNYYGGVATISANANGTWTLGYSPTQLGTLTSVIAWNGDGNVGLGPTAVFGWGGTALTNSSASFIGRAANGIGIVSSAGTSTFNDASTATGTLADRWLYGFGTAPTLTATNASVIYTAASTLYLAGAPAASTNVTITHPYVIKTAAGGISHIGLPVYADNAAAVTGGLIVGDVYQTAQGAMRITV